MNFNKIKLRAYDGEKIKGQIDITSVKNVYRVLSQNYS